MVRSDKTKATAACKESSRSPIVRSTTAPASAARRAKVADRDAKFIEYIKREDVQAKMADMNPSKRMGFAIKSFKEETDITVPTTMAYRAWHKALGAIKVNKDKPVLGDGVLRLPLRRGEQPILSPEEVPNVPDTEVAVLKFSSDNSDNEQPLDSIVGRSPWQAAEHPAENAISEEPAVII